MFIGSVDKVTSTKLKKYFTQKMAEKPRVKRKLDLCDQQYDLEGLEDTLSSGIDDVGR